MKLTEIQKKVLGVVCDAPGSSAADIARTLEFEASTVRHAVGQLRQLNIVNTPKDKHDIRRLNIYVKPQLINDKTNSK